jgi:hypothetical protein
MREEESRTHPVREDMGFQYMAWTVERVAWALLAFIPILSLTGIFAHGALSEQTGTVAGSSFSLQYERFQRETALSRFTAHIPPVGSAEMRLRLSPSFQRTFEIESIQPEPARSTAGTGGLELFFHAPASGELVAVLWTRPRQFGVIPVQAEANPGAAIEFTVVVYP